MYLHIIDRETAKTHGLKKYCTGEPCVRGVVWERRTSSKHCLCAKCKGAISRQSKRYRALNDVKIKSRWVNNKEQLKLQHKDWYARNREDILRKKRSKSGENSEKKNKAQRDRYHNNRARYIETAKSYRELNKVAYRAKASTSRAKKSNAVPSWYGELDDFVLTQCYELSILRTELTGISWCVDHMIPINGFNFVGLHVWNNFQVIPSYLNSIKSNNLFLIDPNEWIEYAIYRSNPH